MEIVLGHTSSMEFWRAKRSHSQTRALLARRGEPRSFRSDSPDVAKPSAGDLERLERIGLAQHANPAHFIVPNALSRVRTARITCSVFDRRIPSSAFVNVGDGVFVASPELCLLLEARTAALANLVETGYEFCGRYRLPALPDGNMAPDQLPLTSVPKLQSLLSRTQDVNGVGAARKAVPHILQNSESPKESQLSMLSSFPGRLGGYGFPPATLNHPVRISEKARGRNVGGTCRCDLFWPDAKLDVEYDGGNHEDPEQMLKDSMRRDALVSMGITVLTVTKWQLENGGSMNAIAHTVAEHTGKRLRYVDPDFTRANRQLRRDLLGF